MPFRRLVIAFAAVACCIAGGWFGAYRAAATETVDGGSPAAIVPSTLGRIGLFQVFDHFSPTNTSMTAGEIALDAHRYDLVWGSYTPDPWRSAEPSMPVGRYYVQELDGTRFGALHDLAWWQANNPDMILYACNGSNVPTHEIAYMYGFTNVPLDISNPKSVVYQIQDYLAPYAVAHHYSAVSIDQVFFTNVMGAQLGTGYYGCGIWQRNGTFKRLYNGKFDPKWAADTVAWVKAARTILRQAHLALVVNHPIGSIYDPNEQQLLANVDATIDEAGFSNYGYYTLAEDAHVFKTTVDYMRYAQAHGVTMLLIDKFNRDTITVSPLQLEYSIATYLMGKEQAADLFVTPANGPGYGYGSEQYHPEYAAPIGTPCGEYYGGPSYDPANPQMYYRKFTGALAVVNSGSLPRASETARLPANHSYKDIEGRPLPRPLLVNSNDAYVLLTSNGCS